MPEQETWRTALRALDFGELGFTRGELRERIPELPEAIYLHLPDSKRLTSAEANRTLREAGLSVPADVSVLGFDDVLAASTNNPPLTTIHQPLRSMGREAAKTVLSLIRNQIPHPRPPAITVFPRLVVRQSTGPVANGKFVAGPAH